MAKKKLKIGVLFGGKSAEHEVSLISASNVVKGLDKNKYEIVLIGINKEGRWLLANTFDYLKNSDNPKLVKLNKSKKEVILYSQGKGNFTSVNNKGDNLKQEGKLDVIFPVMHGPFGEDGSVQGLLKLAGIPFVGPSVLGSAVSMDKDVMKRLFKEADIPIGKFATIRKGDKISFKELSKRLGLPMFIKPANMGSSVGIHKVKNEKEFLSGVKDAFLYDNKVIIEEFIDGREFAVAILGNEKPIASGLCEIITNREFYDYEAKYVDENGTMLQIPAKISKNLVEKARSIAIKAFKTLECEGMARVDFFLRKKDNKFIICEINTIPGFTSHSIYPKLWEASGLPTPKLLDELIRLAIERHNREKKLKTTFK